MLRKFKIDYDLENDSLFLYRGKSRGGVELGNLVFDFDARNELVGLEILSASSMLKELNVGEGKVSKKLLAVLKRCSIDYRAGDGLLIIKLYLYFDGQEPVIAPIHIPSVMSPLAAVA